jgi:hypothetical protein
MPAKWDACNRRKASNNMQVGYCGDVSNISLMTIGNIMDANSIRDTRNKGEVSNSPDASNIRAKNNTKNPRPGPENTTK